MRPAWLHDDPSRQSIMDEIHARPIEFVGAPARVRRIAAMLPREASAVSEAHARFSAWCVAGGIQPPPPTARQHSFDASGRHVTWELHTEFLTLTWSSDLADHDNFPAGIGLELLETLGVVTCMRVDLIADATIPQRIVDGFRLASLCCASIDGGSGEVATDFVPDEDGFIRFEFAAGGVTALRRAIIVRRLLEIETYRALTLMALPLARRVSPDLAEAEADLGRAIIRLGDASGEAAHAALQALQALSVRSGALIETTSFRFAASQAYGELLRRRLRGLHEVGLNGASTIERYLGNRIDPALATCLAVEKRENALASKIERGIELLNATISLDLQSQNRQILHTIAQTSERQLHLQRTVEGLSVIAISYYLIGIVGYALTGAAELTHFSKGMVLAALVPAIVGAVWLVVVRIRRRSSG